MGDPGVNPAVAAGRNGAASRLLRLKARVYTTRRPVLKSDGRKRRNNSPRESESAAVRVATASLADRRAVARVRRRAQPPMPMPMLNRGRTRRRPSRLTRQVMHQMQAGARGEARRRTRRVVCRGARSPRSRMGMERAGRVRKRPSLLPRWQPLAQQSRIRLKAAIQRARHTSGMLPINRHARHLAVTSSRTSADARRPMISTRRSILAPITAVC